jgi:hypothetical protein
MNVSSGTVGAIASDQVLTESNESNVDAYEEHPINHLVTSGQMMYLGLRLLRYQSRRLKRCKTMVNYKRFKSHYGISPCTAAWIYSDMQSTEIEEARLQGSESDLKCFFMALHYLRKYPTKEDIVAIFDYCAFWARQKIWGTIKKIRALKAEKIVWPNDYAQDEIWVIAVDGVHSLINEPSHPTWSQDRRYYSHKFNKAGLDYELGTCLSTNRLLWMNGPFPAGTNDITVFRKNGGLKDELERRKQKAIGDRGYRGENKLVSIPNAHNNPGVATFKSRALKRHENFNSLIKQYAILNGRFRHSIERFENAFEAVCVLSQYRIENEIPLYDILIEDVVNKFKGNP